jgi:hypothetical protein
MEELKPLLIALEPYTADTYVADNIKNAQAKILKVEALLPEAKMRFESSIIINKIRPLLTPIDVRRYQQSSLPCFGMSHSLRCSRTNAATPWWWR